MPIVGERETGTVKILGYDYRIVMIPEQVDIRASGDAHASVSQIRVAEDMCLQQRVSTLLHESLHMFQYHLGLGLDEESTSRLEAALFCFFKENGIDLSPLERLVMDQTTVTSLGDYNTVEFI